MLGLTFTLTLGRAAAACDMPICQLPQDQLQFGRVITFDDLPSSGGVGREVPGILQQPGAQFGERFAGQQLLVQGNFDQVRGGAIAPLKLLPGAQGQSLGIMRLLQTSVLQGHGPRGFPHVDAIGEGAVAVVFDRDQAMVGLDIRGGEQGQARILFLRRDGSIIDTLELAPLAEANYGFVRHQRQADIAGLVIVNTDPQGIALDNLRFDGVDLLGQLQYGPNDGQRGSHRHPA